MNVGRGETFGLSFLRIACEGDDWIRRGLLTPREICRAVPMSDERRLCTVATESGEGRSGGRVEETLHKKCFISVLRLVHTSKGSG